MNFNQESKQELIRRLLIAKEKAHMLEIILRFRGLRTEAETVAEHTSVLSGQIDSLIIEVMTDWLGQADEIIEAVRHANVSIQAAIRDIEKGKKIAQGIVKAIGLIDDASSLVKSVLRVF